MSLRDKVIELRRVPVAELIPNPKNWRTHSKGQTQALQGLITEVGFAGAALARQGLNGELVLIDGHLRRDALPDEQIPVLVTDLTEEEADKVLATFDPIGAMAGRDAEALEALLANVTTDNDGLRRLLEDLWEGRGKGRGIRPRRRGSAARDRHQARRPLHPWRSSPPVRRLHKRGRRRPPVRGPGAQSHGY